MHHKSKAGRFTAEQLQVQQQQQQQQQWQDPVCHVAHAAMSRLTCSQNSSIFKSPKFV
jgi:hypothetical protein